MKKKVSIFLFVLIFIGIVGFLPATTNNEPPCSFQLQTENFVIRKFSFVVEVADADETRHCGLSYRVDLREDQGMLFVFEEVARHGIWMKEMNFPLDIIWLDKNLRVINIVENATPASFPEVFSPESPALYVLEVNAGFVDKHTIFVEDIMQRLGGE